MEDTKKCCRCNKQKASDEFKEGKKTCKSCLEQVSQYRKDNPEKRSEIYQRYYDKKKEEILEQKKEKVWCECCRKEARKDGWLEHTGTDKRRYYLTLEEGDELRRHGKTWCSSCRVLITKKNFSKHKRTMEHLRLEELERK